MATTCGDVTTETDMNPAYNAKLERAVDLHRRAKRLLRNLRALPKDALQRRDVHFARYYNNLRKDVRDFVDDPEIRRLVPGPVWSLESRYLPFGLLATLGFFMLLLVVDVLGWLMISAVEFFLRSMVFAVATVFFMTLVTLIASPNDFWWWRASKVTKVIEYARRLESFLVDYLPERYPELEVCEENSTPTANSRGSGNQRTAHLKQELAELQSSYSVLSRRINELDTDIGVTTENFRKGGLKEQRESLANERDDVAQEISEIEVELERLGRSR